MDPFLAFPTVKHLRYFFSSENASKFLSGLFFSSKFLQMLRIRVLAWYDDSSNARLYVPDGLVNHIPMHIPQNHVELTPVEIIWIIYLVVDF